MDNKNIKAVIAIGVIIFLVIIGIAVFANMGPADNTVADQTEAQMTEPVAPDINYGEISTEQIESIAMSSYPFSVAAINSNGGHIDAIKQVVCIIGTIITGHFKLCEIGICGIKL